MRKLKRLTYKVPVNFVDNKVEIRKDNLLLEGGSLNSIIIDENALNKNILKVRYLNSRKLNNVLKHDYKISKRMKDAIKFKRVIHKLSKNEKEIYYLLQNYLNKSLKLSYYNEYKSYLRIFK